MPDTNPHHERRWLILAVLGIAQLMVVLDATIVNIALPSAQASLHFSDDGRQWVVTAYALSFGSLLLLGGRISDLFGRKRTFIIGLIGFALASALGGAAQSFGMFVGARAVQGAFGALLAPSALSLLTTTFTDARERAQAFGLYGAIAGSGASIGLLLGGALTEVLNWRFTMYVNLIFAVIAVAGALALLVNQRPTERPRLDLPGAATVTGGLFSLVYGLSHAQTTSWSNTATIAFLAAAAILLGAFVTIERRVEHPLLPPRVVTDRNRGAAYLSIGTAAAAIFAVFMFLTYYLQQNLGFSPVLNGVAFLPMTAMVVLSAGVASTRLVPRVGPRPLVVTGMALGAIGMLHLTGLTVHSSYVTAILPSLLVLGLGFGLIFAPAMSAATLGVGTDDAGVASALVNANQQVGGSVGIALLSTFAASATTSFLAGSRPTPALLAAATVHGYTTAFAWSAAIFALGAVVAFLLFRPGERPAELSPAPVAAH
ncbi:MAG TPA: MFS transporter [Solirubrobacteraceae bacterium]|nr:MFS transporter [Solirubrobacteraceae bacterium]